MEDKSQQLNYFKEKLNKQLDSVKELLGEYRYKVFSVMVNTCNDYDELKMMADIEMQLDSLEYTQKLVKNRLDKRDVNIKDIRLSTDRIQREIKKFEIIEPEEQKSVIANKFNIITPDTLQSDIESDDVMEEALNSIKYSATMTPADEANYLRELQNKMKEINDKKIESIDIDEDLFSKSDIDTEDDDDEYEEDNEMLNEMFGVNEDDVLNSIPDETNEEDNELIDLDPDTEKENTTEEDKESVFEDDTDEEMSTDDKINSILDDDSLFDDYDDEETEEENESETENANKDNYLTEKEKDESDIIGDGLDEIFENTDENEESTLENSLDECFDSGLDEDEDKQDIFDENAVSEDISLSDSIDNVLGDASLFEDDTFGDNDETEETNNDTGTEIDPFDSFEDDFMGDNCVSVEEDVFNSVLSQPKDKSLLSNAGSVSSKDILELKNREARVVTPSKVFISDSQRGASTQHMFNMLCSLFDKSEINAKSLIKKTSKAANNKVDMIKNSSLINF